VKKKYVDPLVARRNELRCEATVTSEDEICPKRAHHFYSWKSDMQKGVYATCNEHELRSPQVFDYKVISKEEYVVVGVMDS
jgi:hypothetical protein